MTRAGRRARVKDSLIDSEGFRTSMRALFAVRGLRAVAHLLRSKLLRDRSIIIDDFDDDLRFSCNLSEHMGSQIYWRGCYSWAQLRALDRVLQDGMVFVDAGANQGEFSIFAAKRLPNGRVIAFEPVSELRERLSANIDLNSFDNIDVIGKALWSSPDTLELHRHTSTYRDGSVNEGLGSLFGPASSTSATEVVECVSLDTALEVLGIDRVDVIKIDVEGAESAVLRGAAATIETDRPILMVEADRDQAAAAGVDLDSLVDGLESRYSVEVIERDGSTSPLRRSRMRAHEDLLCLPL